MPGRRQDTALGVARARFTDSLPRKATEIRGALTLLVAAPGADRPREALRRKLQSLSASAQVFRIVPLAEALKAAVATLDAARDDKRPLTEAELDSLSQLGKTLPELGGVGQRAEGASIPPPEAKPAKTFEKKTATKKTFAPPPPDSKYAPKAPSALKKPAGGGQSDLPASRSAYKIPQPQKVAPAAKGNRPTTKTGMPAVKPQAPRLRASGGGLAAAPAPAPSSPAPMKSSTTTTPGGHASPLEAVVVSVVVLGGAANEASIKQALSADQYEIHVARDAEEALRLARTVSPDVIIAEAGLAAPEEASLLERLRSDVLTDFLPVVLLFGPGGHIDNVALREQGAAEGMRTPIDADRLRRAISRLTELGPVQGFDALGSLTAEEVANRLADEIRRGLVEGLDRGADVSVPLGDGTEILAAAWSAIARVRSHLSDRSSGRVHFRDPSGRRGPALVSIGEGETTDHEVEVELTGRRVLLVDDDPAVLWFFAELLSEAGAMVVQAEDGLQALDAARQAPPDVILTDILMPRMDGLSLCRALDRDPALSEIPVILLSWKEDFLARMRELRAGASGYLRKEAQAGQILEKVREVLRPRARLESRLRAGGAVRGRVEGLGVPALLEVLREVRPNARLTVRDAWGLIEVEVNEGNVVDITSTAADGGFARGDRALLQLVGVSAGRYTVAEVDGPPRASMMGSAPRQTAQESVAQLGAVLDAVSADNLARVDGLTLDIDTLESFERSSPAEVVAVVKRLAEQASPRVMLTQEGVSPAALETTLRSLARRGAVHGVRGPAGEDLVAAARDRRAKGEVAAAAEAPQVPTPTPTPAPAAPVIDDAPSTRPAAGRSGPMAVSPDQVGKLLSQITEVGTILDEADEPPANAEPEPVELVTEHEVVELVAEAEPVELVAEAEPVELVSEAEAVELVAEAEPVDLVTSAELEPVELVPSAEPVELVAPEPEPVELVPSAEPVELVASDELDFEDVADVVEPSPAVIPPTAAGDMAAPARPAHPTAPERPSGSLVDQSPMATPRPRPEPDEEKGGPGVIAWLLGLALLMVLGYMGYRFVDGTRRQEPEPEVPAAPDTPSQPTEPASAAPEPEAGSATEGDPSQPVGGTPDDDAFGALRPGIDGAAVDVPEGWGLLQVIGRSEAQIHFDERNYGAPPLQVALPEGRHQIEFRGEEGTRYRYYFVRAGHTRVVPVPQ